MWNIWGWPSSTGHGDRRRQYRRVGNVVLVPKGRILKIAICSRWTFSGIRCGMPAPEVSLDRGQVRDNMGAVKAQDPASLPTPKSIVEVSCSNPCGYLISSKSTDFGTLTGPPVVWFHNYFAPFLSSLGTPFPYSSGSVVVVDIGLTPTTSRDRYIGPRRVSWTIINLERDRSRSGSAFLGQTPTSQPSRVLMSRSRYLQSTTSTAIQDLTEVEDGGRDAPNV